MLTERSYYDAQAVAGPGMVALESHTSFVGRTINWLYDHLRYVRRYDPVVLCSILQNRDEFPELAAWCLPNNFPRRAWRRLSGTRFYPSDIRRLRRLVPRVLHSHFGYVALHDYELRSRLDIPWIVSFYGADVYSALDDEFRSKYARLFDEVTQVLALGPVMKSRLEQLGCPAEKITVHPLGVDVESLPHKSRVLASGERLKLLFAGTFREKKGLQYVIEAAGLARRRGLDFDLQIVGDATGKRGDCEYKAEVFAQIQRLGLEDMVVHHGCLKFHQLVDLALRSHVFLGPSVTAENGDAEGTPFVLQQMMATGMPAIATIHSDIPFLFGDQAKLLVPERDATAIADRLLRYVDAPDTLATDGAALRHQIHREFEVGNCAGRLSDLYDKFGRDC